MQILDARVSRRILMVSDGGNYSSQVEEMQEERFG